MLVYYALTGLKPGLTGIGSIVFRDEEKLLSGTKLSVDEFYEIHISPYKGEKKRLKVKVENRRQG
jgi:hypothetical protein